jgi:anthranilate/para-aminobenzoate synthase component II
MHTARIPEVSSTGFLDVVASQLKIGRSSAHRHAVQRILEKVKKNFEAGEYHSTTEAELTFRKLVDREDQSNDS